MGLIKIKSDNPDLSYIISKNPETGMVSKVLRDGVVFGWYTQSKTNEYNIFFKDSDDTISYSDSIENEFEYNTVDKYNMSIMYANMLDKLINIKEDNQYDKSGYTYSLHLNMLYLKNEKYYDIFTRHMSDIFKIDLKQVSYKNYTCTISTDKSRFKDLVDFTMLFLIVNTMMNYNNFFVDNSSVGRFSKLIAKLDLPYFIRYVYKVNAFKSPKQFDEFSSIFNESETNSYDIKFGRNYYHRYNFVKNNLKFDKNIIDIGCGEGGFFKNSKSLGDDLVYYAIDTDTEVLDLAVKKAKNKSFENIVFNNSFDEFLTDRYNNEKCDVQLIEVVEHIDYDKSIELLKVIRDNINFERIIITTPNRDFNDNYYNCDELIGDGEETFKRHDDHKFELTLDELKSFIGSVFNDEYNVNYTFIGDVVNGITPTFGVVINKKG